MNMPVDNKNELETALLWLQSGKPVVIATVISTWGSSPRPVGSHMVINSQCNFRGSVSGGCVEGAVITEALEIIESGRPRILEFSVSSAEAWEVGLSCGGSISVLLERRLTPGLLVPVRDHLANNHGFSMLSDIDTGDSAVFYNGRLTADQVWPDAGSVCEAVADVTRSGLSQRIQVAERQLFVRSFRPAVRLYLIGAVHISQVLAPMARLLGYQVTVIDPRELFAESDRFPDQTLVACWPDEVISADRTDAGTAIVTLTHDPKIDDIALELALASDAFYIGALGSQRTHQQRVRRLTERGFGPQLDRIHAPVGLKLGGRAPEEIATAILAQIVQARYR